MARRPLVAFFSRDGENFVGDSCLNLSLGITRVLAKRIALRVNGRLFSIEPAVPYPAGYRECLDQARRELEDQARPKLAASSIRLSSYRTVFLGWPNWWNTMPMPVFTFLESFDTAGKRIAPFCTHEGTGFADSLKHLRILCPKAEILPGLAVAGTEVDAPETARAIGAWLAEAFGNEY